jgi:hypothetical protein
MLHMYLSIFGCHGHELEQFLSNSFCTWQHGVEGVDVCKIWRSQEESVSLGFLIKKTLQLPKKYVYKEASEPEETPEEFLKP